MARKPPDIPLPEAWSKHIKSGILHVILSQGSRSSRRARARPRAARHTRLRAEVAEGRREISQLQRELRLKDLRMSRVRPRRRPHYRAVEGMAILELRAESGWSRRETARRFLLQPATVAAWTRRVDEGGERALLETPEPVNRLPDIVRYIVKRLAESEIPAVRHAVQDRWTNTQGRRDRRDW